jgi:hypothetical protein
LPTKRTAFRFLPDAVDAVSLKTPPILAQKPLSVILDFRTPVLWVTGGNSI